MGGCRGLAGSTAARFGISGHWMWRLTNCRARMAPRRAALGMTPDGAAVMAMIRLSYVTHYLDKAGKVRRYSRKPGCKPVMLPGVPGSREFMEAYEAAIGTPLERP